MMKPYSKAQILQDANKRMFNYCLSKARRVSENAFGIMCAIFRIFFTPIYLKPETVDLVVTVCCCLHNLLRNEYLSENPFRADITQNLEDFPTENLIPLAGTGGFTESEGFQVRSRLITSVSTVTIQTEELLLLRVN